MSVRAALLVAAVALGALPAGFAHASEPIEAPAAEAARPLGVTVTVILARKAATALEVASELAALGPALGRAFPEHRRFTRLARHALSVTSEGPAPVTLPNGSSLTLRHAGLRDGRHALQVEVGGLRTSAQVAPGATFFQAGRAHDGGMLVLAFEVAR